MSKLELHLESVTEPLDVRHVSARESLSEPFAVTVWARSPSDDLDFEAIVGRVATVTVTSGLLWAAGVTRRWSGVVERVAQLETDQSTLPGALGALRPTLLSLYQIRIVPRFALLAGRTNHRVFVHRTIPEIVAEILKEHRIEPVWKIDRPAYPKLPLRTQYGESDLAFVSRLLEEAGITYLFDDAREQESWLVLSDAPQRADVRVPLPWVDRPIRALSGDFVASLRLTRRVRPGKVTLRDHDSRRDPRFVLQGATAPVKPPGPEDALERYAYRPGLGLIEVDAAAAGADTPVGDDLGAARHDEEHAEQRATRALEAHRAVVPEVAFETSALDVTAGNVLAFAGHPRADLSVERRWLVVESTLEVDTHEPWQHHARAVAAEPPYRPEPRTPKPVAHAVESAVVVGPAGAEIHTDELGRVRVQFPWDRVGGFDEKVSPWIRVSQGWAGAGYGLFTVPRVGHEVLVAFLAGDPDQPVIVGRLHGGTTPVPHVLPEHATRSAFRTRSSPGGEGHNELGFEDAAGEELVYQHAQRDAQEIVENDRGAVVGELDTTLVGERWLSHMKGSATAMQMVDDRIELTTGRASLELDRDKIRIVAQGRIHVKSEGGDVVLKGGPHVFVNVGGEGAVVDVDRPPAPRPDKPLLPGERPCLKLGPNKVYKDMIMRASQRTGMPPRALAGMINSEAPPGPNGLWLSNDAENGSHAAGLTQFVRGTWRGEATTPGTYLNQVAQEKGLVKQVAGKFVQVPGTDADLLALRGDAETSIMAGAEYDMRTLRNLQADGVVPPDGQLTPEQLARYAYVGHHEGEGGARTYLSYADSQDEAFKAAFEAQHQTKYGDLLAAQYGYNSKKPPNHPANVAARAKADKEIAEHGGVSARAYKTFLERHIARKMNLASFACTDEAVDGDEAPKG